uniref:Guanine nucleotide-binding protein G(S) subunit alpha n=1 Tax=Panagrellus redivivus TaxID=6233 RepID=A0A7E4VBU2_PANRE
MFRFLDERTLASVASMQTTEHSPHSKYSITRELERMLPAANDDDSCFVAVCGGNKAGKRTFFKQLEIVGKGRFQTEADRQQFATVVQRFVIDNMRRVVAALCNGFLVQYDNLSHLWDSDLQKRLLFFAYARTTFQKIAACYGSAFPQIVRNISGLDNWAPECLMECGRILSENYCPSLDDFLRVVPLEGGDRCEINWKGVKYDFFDYDMYHQTPPYNQYRSSKHRFVYIMDFGAPVTRLPDLFVELYKIIGHQTCPFDVFFNKTQILETRGRQEVYTMFGIQALVIREAWNAARSGKCLVRCTFSNLVLPSDGTLITDMFNCWTDPVNSEKFY